MRNNNTLISFKAKKRNYIINLYQELQLLSKKKQNII